MCHFSTKCFSVIDNLAGNYMIGNYNLLHNTFTEEKISIRDKRILQFFSTHRNKKHLMKCLLIKPSKSTFSTSSSYSSFYPSSSRQSLTFGSAFSMQFFHTFLPNANKPISPAFFPLCFPISSCLHIYIFLGLASFMF